MTERMSVPPEEPAERRMTPFPVPMIIPARRAARSGSETGMGTQIHSTAAEKTAVPTRL